MKALDRKILGVLIVAIAIVMVAASCGGGSDSDANEAEGSKTFLKKGSQSKIPKFGEEADEDEREDASEALEENLQAREDGDFETQCSSLGAAALKIVEEEASLMGVKGGCAKELKAQAEPLPETKQIRANTMTGPIDALRIKGDSGFALYHGTSGKDYAMKMKKEDGEWKVDSLRTTEIR